MVMTNRTRPIPTHPLDGGPPEPIDDRAQPGDVLGIEEDGEVTHLGDTREDEDERREDAEEAVRETPPSKR